jgi:large subunit ribosomal protein L3
MAKYSKPRAGSLAYVPRKRAKKETPRVHSWVDSGEVNMLGFAGYKAGMTNVLAIDNRKNSPTAGMEIFVPVTVIETPPMVVVALRAYKKGYSGEETLTEVWAEELYDDLRKRLTMPKKRKPDKGLKDIEGNMENVSDIRLITHTQPRLTAMPKKKPDLMEIAVGGSLPEKFELAKGLLGKEVNPEDVFHENKFVDVTAVTKGKGFQGPVKRFGIKIQPRKAGKGRRHIGSGGAWKPARKMWREPLPGQMGYHTRTEYNKVILQIGKDGSKATPAGGFLRYGPVNRDYIILVGSVPGPAKRLVRLTHPRRPCGDVNFEVTHINLASKQGV